MGNVIFALVSKMIAVVPTNLLKMTLLRATQKNRLPPPPPKKCTEMNLKNESLEYI